MLALIRSAGRLAKLALRQALAMFRGRKAAALAADRNRNAVPVASSVSAKPDNSSETIRTIPTGRLARDGLDGIKAGRIDSIPPDVCPCTTDVDLEGAAGSRGLRPWGAAGEHIPAAATSSNSVSKERRSVNGGPSVRDDEAQGALAAGMQQALGESERFVHPGDVQQPKTEPANSKSAAWSENEANPAATGIEYQNVISNARADTAPTYVATLDVAQDPSPPAANTEEDDCSGGLGEAAATDLARRCDEDRPGSFYGSSNLPPPNAPGGPENMIEEVRAADPGPGKKTDATISPLDAPDNSQVPASLSVCADPEGPFLDAETGLEIADATTGKLVSSLAGEGMREEDEAHPMSEAGTLQPSARRDTGPRSPPTYRPRLDRSRPKRHSAPAKAPAEREYQDLEADLQILFRPGDWGIEMSALLRLPAGTEEVTVRDGGDEIWLGALDDRFLEPLVLTDSSRILSEGLSITAVGLPVRWRRSSRDIHVFRQHGSVAGFVSQPRVAIGQENVVVCRDDLAGAALAQIAAIGAGAPIRIEGPGVPPGWACWRGISPARPASPGDGLAILHALDPLPAVSVELVGGLQLSRGHWLEGHPPSIRLLGLVEPGEPVWIDGRLASREHDGAWTADGWDCQGIHRIEHGGISATYEIEPGTSSWDWWPAWGETTAVAGALASAHGREYFHTGPFAYLLGPAPGEICGFCASSGDIYAARPEFAPVWLLARRPGMRRAVPYLIGMPLPPSASAATSAPAVTQWVRAICSTGRTGASGSLERRLWDQYLATAKNKQKWPRR